jgi:hypothetical protein
MIQERVLSLLKSYILWVLSRMPVHDFGRDILDD